MTAPRVALIDFTMHDPFRHCLSRTAHEADAIFHGSSEKPPAIAQYRVRQKGTPTSRRMHCAGSRPLYSPAVTNWATERLSSAGAQRKTPPRLRWFSGGVSV